MSRLFDDLTATLRAGRLAAPGITSEVDADSDALRDAIELLEQSTYGLLEERQLAVPVGEMRLLAAWFRSAAEQTRRLTSESERAYGPEDVTLAEELARRAAHIIENARLHDQLRQSESRFRLALNTVNVVVFEQDLDLRYRFYYNPAAPGRDFVGKTQLEVDLMLPDEAQMLAALKRRVIETGQPLREEVWLTVYGERICYLDAVDPLRDGSGAIIGVIGAAADITREKAAQAELLEALAFRDRMIGVLGHDLRNPLGAVLGFARLSLRDSSSRDCSSPSGRGPCVANRAGWGWACSLRARSRWRTAERSRCGRRT